MTRSELFRGRYLFHVHTTLTDGTLSIAEYLNFASVQRLDRVIFLEHVRRIPSYDCRAFTEEVRRASAERRVPASIGFEAKVLPSGYLDIDEAHAAMSDVLGIAEHAFPHDLDALTTALLHAFDHYRSLFPDKPLIWVHPGTNFRKLGVDPDQSPQYELLVERATRMAVALERNVVHGLASERRCALLGPQNVVIGANAHSRDDLNIWLQHEISAMPAAGSKE